MIENMPMNTTASFHAINEENSHLHVEHSVYSILSLW